MTEFVILGLAASLFDEMRGMDFTKLVILGLVGSGFWSAVMAQNGVFHVFLGLVGRLFCLFRRSDLAEFFILSLVGSDFLFCCDVCTY